jgi:hypothetical protein
VAIVILGVEGAIAVCFLWSGDRCLIFVEWRSLFVFCGVAIVIFGCLEWRSLFDFLWRGDYSIVGMIKISHWL